MTNISELIHMGDRAYMQGDLQAAEECFRRVLSARPNYADVRNRLGVVLTALGRREEAIDQFISAIQINPRYVEARLNLAITYQEMGLFERAKDEFFEVWKNDPDNRLAREALGFR